MSAARLSRVVRGAVALSDSTGLPPGGQSYGLPDGDRDALVTAVRLNHEWCYDIVGTAAANGHASFTEYLDGGARYRAERTRDWYLAAADVLRDALH